MIAASAGASSSGVAPPLRDPKAQQQTNASRPHTGSTSASLLRKAPTKKASFSRLSTQSQAASPTAASSSVPAINAQAASDNLVGDASTKGPLKKPPSRQPSETQPKAAHHAKTASSAGPSASSPAETATAATSQTSRALPSSPSAAAASYSLPAASKAQSARHRSSSLPRSDDQLSTTASQSSSPLADDWESFLGSPTVGKSTRPPSVNQRRTHSSQRLATSTSSGDRAAKTPHGDPSTAVKAPQRPLLTAAKAPQSTPSTAATNPQAGPPTAVRSSQGTPSTSTPAAQLTAPLHRPETPPTSQAVDSVTTQVLSATRASSRMAQAKLGSQAPAASLQDRAASAAPAQQRLLPRPAAKLTGKEPAAKGGLAKQASPAAGDASSAGSVMPRPTENAAMGTGTKADAGSVVLSPQGIAAELALTHASAAPERPSLPEAASTPRHFVPPVSMGPATSRGLNPSVSTTAESPSGSAPGRQALTAPATSAPSAVTSSPVQFPSSAQVSAFTKEPKAGSTASSTVFAVAAADYDADDAAAQSDRHGAGSTGSSNSAIVPQRSGAKSPLTCAPAAAAAAATDVGHVDRLSERPKPGFPPPAFASVARPTSNAASAAATAADDDNDNTGDDGSGEHSQAERQTLPASKAAKADAWLSPSPTPPAVAGITPLAAPLIPFAGPGTSPTGLLDEDGDDFFAGVEADLGSAPSTGNQRHSAQAEDTTQAGRHSQQLPQRASPTRPSKPLATLPAQARPDIPGRTSAGITTAVAPPAAASTVSSTASPAASSTASSAAAALGTHPAAALPFQSSSSGAKAPMPKPAGITPRLSTLLPTAVEAPATAESVESVLMQSQQSHHASAQQSAATYGEEVSGAGGQSAFVPIPFGGSSAAASRSGTGTLLGSKLDADQDDLDDSFFDSIDTGAGVLPTCMSS